MEKQALVIVESPTKAKTIRKFLPKNFTVEASMGHIRDLPQSAADIPPKVKKEPWARIGVNVDSDFEPLYVVPKGKSKIIADLRDKLKKCSVLYLATDEDREGESISWHLTETLKPKVPVKRMVFHEITKSAIEEALKKCREVDLRLVRAQETRRILDRLVGFTLSPILWKKVAYGLSAGRVQSVALRIMVDRERERMRFKRAVYWDLQATLGATGKAFKARLVSLKDKKVAQGRDFDEKTGTLKDPSSVLVLDEKQVRALAGDLQKAAWKVLSFEEKSLSAKPSAPFITSTLQQEANRKLGLSTRDSMRVAQSLYEHGFITYMRTDSPSLSQEALDGVRGSIARLFGKEFLSDGPRQYVAKSKGAQEAHEAIRPAGPNFVPPEDTGLTGAELGLYTLIWRRTLASQMADAQKSLMTIKIGAGDAQFSASGTKIVFPGFLKVYQESGEDSDDSDEVILPAVREGQALDLQALEPQEHETKPPPRFTEASLVQAMEKAGIGRPSTYASVISTLIDRGYVTKNGTTIVPGFTGFAVTQLLEKHFDNLVDVEFTSRMEESLDEIAEGELDYLEYLKKFYLGKQGLKDISEKKEKEIDPRSSRAVHLPQLGDDVEVRIGRYGPYLVKGDEDDTSVYASIPEDVAPADLDLEQTERILQAKAEGPKSIGTDPKSGKPIYCLVGRYGAYLQIGQVEEGAEKPRRASLPRDKDPRTITLEEALKLLSLPRELGKHPDTGEMVMVYDGRFGPYVKHQQDMRSLKKTDDKYTVDLKRAVELLKEEKKGRFGAKIVKEMGAHPADSKPIQVLEGKFGLYLKHAKTNATLPKEVSVDTLTLEQAVAILAAREQQAAAKGGRGKSAGDAGAKKTKSRSKAS